MFWSMSLYWSARAAIALTPKRSYQLCHSIVYSDLVSPTTPDGSQGMPEPIDRQYFAGPHPTCREFVAQLTGWGFTQRREEHLHTVFRGPRGGTLRVIRSELGRADPALVEKAARLAGVTTEQFWSGPQRQPGPPPPPDTARAGVTSPRRKRAAHDSIVSVVL